MAEPAWMLDTNALSDLIRNPRGELVRAFEQGWTRRRLHQHRRRVRIAFRCGTEGLGQAHAAS